MSKNNKLAGSMLGLLSSLLPIVALAQDAPAPVPTIDSGDTAWMLVSTALVLMMTIPGLALFYAGMVRAKNALSIMMQCFTITCMVTLLWVLFGYSLAFTDGGSMQSWIGGLSKAFMAGVGLNAIATPNKIPETVFVMFQMTFAIITPALIVGAFAERMKFSALLWFTGLWVIVVYAPIAHWVWGSGWLSKLGALDFAGGTVVHINAGMAGFLACLMIGKRLGYPTTPMPPHNLGLTLIGASLLWVGWFGFNAGSAVAANATAGMAMTVTQVATAAAAMAWMFSEWIMHGKPTTLGIASGAVAGLVAITPASGYVGPMGAIVLGLIAGIVCFLCATKLKRALGYDDSLDVFGVHAVGGIIGALLTGVFASADLGGVGYAQGITMGQQVGIQAVAVISTIVYDLIVSFILLKILDVLIGLRVSEEEESEGLDIAQHEERAYNL
jgi:Amt family ammonium transporter